VAGTIGVSASRRWSVASWLFDWALRQTAEQLGPGPTTDRLHEIVQYNLGWFGLDDVPLSERPRVVAAFGQLPRLGNERLPADLARRDHVLGTLQDLADLAQQAIP
jgi:hypothetical protein